MGLVGSYHHYIFVSNFHTKDYRALEFLTVPPIISKIQYAALKLHVICKKACIFMGSVVKIVSSFSARSTGEPKKIGVLTMSIYSRNYIAKLAIDLFLGSVLCTFGAFYLRFVGNLGLYASQVPRYTLISSVPLLAAELLWKLHLRSWRGIGTLDLMTPLQAMLFFGLATSALSFFAREIVTVPRNVTVINTLLAILSLGGIRILYRYYCERSNRGARRSWVKPKKILGAGDAGVLIVREMLHHGAYKEYQSC